MCGTSVAAAGPLELCRKKKRSAFITSPLRHGSAITAAPIPRAPFSKKSLRVRILAPMSLFRIPAILLSTARRQLYAPSGDATPYLTPTTCAAQQLQLTPLPSSIASRGGLECGAPARPYRRARFPYPLKLIGSPHASQRHGGCRIPLSALPPSNAPARPRAK